MGDPLASRRFSRLVSPHGVRRLALPRIVLAALASAGVLGTLAVLGTFTLRSLPEYVHGQPAYQFQFREIVLDPPPPPWYLGGSAAFLERLRAAGKEPERQSVLDLDLERLRGLVRLDPWVRRVDRIERAYPNRVVVHLAYREPVSFVSFSQGGTFVLDGEGVILPAKDIDREVCGPLIGLNWTGKVPPVDPAPGETWKRASASGDGPEVEELVVRGAGLAAYLKSVQDELERGPGERLAFSVLAEMGKPNRLWVWYGHRLFKWGEAPGLEPPGEMNADEKWEVLRDWLHESPAPTRGPQDSYEYYLIGPNGIERHPTQSSAAGPPAAGTGRIGRVGVPLGWRLARDGAGPMAA